MTPEQRQRANARAYANSYKRRGKLVQQPCEVCGSPDSQMHHDDYSKPLEVRWMCRKCHKDHHVPNPLPKRTEPILLDATDHEAIEAAEKAGRKVWIK